MLLVDASKLCFWGVDAHSLGQLAVKTALIAKARRPREWHRIRAIPRLGGAQRAYAAATTSRTCTCPLRGSCLHDLHWWSVEVASDSLQTAGTFGAGPANHTSEHLMILHLLGQSYLQMRIIIIKVSGIASNEVKAMSEHGMANGPRPVELTTISVSYPSKALMGECIGADPSLRCALSESLVVGLIRDGVLCAEDLRCLDQSSCERLKCLVLRSCVRPQPKC